MSKLYRVFLMLGILLCFSQITAQDLGRYDVRSLAYSPDGSKIAVAGGPSLCDNSPESADNYGINILDAVTEDVLQVLRGSVCSI